MKKLIPYIGKGFLCAYFLFGLVHLANGEENSAQIIQQKSSSELVFSVEELEVFENGPTLPDVLILSIEVANHSATRKFDLTNIPGFSLHDNFDNHYRQVLKPTSYREATYYPNAHYPSLYPGETFRMVLFFEPPVRGWTELNLLVDANALRVPDQIVLTIPAVEVESRVPDVGDQKSAQPRLAIVHPLDGGKVNPGETIFMKLEVNFRDSPPESIVIFAPHYTYEDFNVVLEYDLRIPDDQPAGHFTVLVLAKWPVSPFAYETESLSITLQVQDPAEACLQDCLEKGLSLSSAAF